VRWPQDEIALEIDRAYRRAGCCRLHSGSGEPNLVPRGRPRQPLLAGKFLGQDLAMSLQVNDGHPSPVVAGQGMVEKCDPAAAR